MRAPRKSTLNRVLTLPLLLAWLSGCSAWRSAEPVRPVLRQQQPELVRVTLTDDSQTQLYNAWIAGDSLFGYRTRPPEYAELDKLPREAIALTDVKEVELRTFDAGGTIATVTAGVAVTAVMFLALGDLWEFEFK